MGFEGADGKEGLIRGMKGERERERREKVAGVGSDDPHHHHPRTTSSSASTLANEAGYYTVRPSFFRDVRALFFCALNWTILEGGGLPSYSVGMCVNISSSSGVALTRQKFN